MSPSGAKAGSLTDAKGNTFVLRPIDCPTCGKRQADVVGLRGGAYHRYGLGVPTTIARCRFCGLLYPDPFPFPVDEQKLYGDPDKYFGDRDTAGKVAYARSILGRLTEQLGRPIASLLDVGSGRGEILHAARLTGIERVIGLELSDAMVAQAAEKYGVTILRRTIEQYAAESPAVFDVVVLNAVLEHVHFPDTMIQAVSALTRPGSLVYIDLPNEPHLTALIGNAVNRIRRNPAVYNLSPTFPPYHVFGFNPKALRKLLDKHGFAVRSLDVWASPHIPSRGGFDWMRAKVGEQIMRLANLTKTAGNMVVVAERLP